MTGILSNNRYRSVGTESSSNVSLSMRCQVMSTCPDRHNPPVPQTSHRGMKSEQYTAIAAVPQPVEAAYRIVSKTQPRSHVTSDSKVWRLTRRRKESRHLVPRQTPPCHKHWREVTTTEAAGRWPSFSQHSHKLENLVRGCCRSGPQ